MDTIVLCGISTNIGVKSTARCTSYGFQQVFAEDAMFSMSAEQHNAAVSFIFRRRGRDGRPGKYSNRQDKYMT